MTTFNKLSKRYVQFNWTKMTGNKLPVLVHHGLSITWKHIIGIAYREKLIDEFLGQVASAGRPKKVSKALSK
jgi:hypothetical protein